MKNYQGKEAISFARRIADEVPDLIGILVDPWRGLNAVYEKEVCNNNCEDCSLHNYIESIDRNRRDIGGVDFRLQSASELDKRLFGPQNNLNCKSFSEISKAFITVLNKTQERTPKVFEQDVIAELRDLEGVRVIYMRDVEPENYDSILQTFRQSVISSARLSFLKEKSKLNKFNELVLQTFGCLYYQL